MKEVAVKLLHRHSIEFMEFINLWNLSSALTALNINSEFCTLHVRITTTRICNDFNKSFYTVERVAFPGCKFPKFPE